MFTSNDPMRQPSRQQFPLSPGSPESPYAPYGGSGSEDYDYYSDAVGSDYGDDVDEDEEARPEPLHPDILYGHEFMYWLVTLIRGSTAGRKLKRTIFKICGVLMVANFPLIVIAYIEDRTFEIGQYFSLSAYGAALHVLMWLTAAPGFFLGAASLLFIRYWASLCTNRLLLTNIIRVYMCVLFLYFFIVTYTVAVLFLTFGKVQRWQDTILLARIFPFYLCTIIFICPLELGLVFYLMDISYFLDEIGNPGAIIDEPDPPVDTMDLSDVTATQLIMVTVSFPFLIFIQLFDLCVAIKRAAVRYFNLQNKQRIDALVAKEQSQAALPTRRRSYAIVRCLRTLRRFCGRLAGALGAARGNRTSPTASADDVEFAGGEGQMQELRPQIKDRELEERLAREMATEEEARKFERRAQHQQALREEDNARLRREEEYKADLEAKAVEEMRERERISRAPTLDVPAFKSKWSETAQAGSFQCKLRASPELNVLTEHMRQMGFYVVFAAVPAENEVELGVCNIRELGTEPWFMARFLASQGTFSAVMKSEDPASAPTYVKKFSLAKVLKIDASSVKR